MARAQRHRTAVVTSLTEPAPGLRASWERQPWVLRILRAFLGVTFLYAGLQKFLDPNFLHSGSPDFIGSQLQSFAQGSPIAPVLHLLNTLPVLTGVGIAVTEAAIGIATLLGIAPATSAALGFVINVMLFLSATWRVHPYFLGSDSIYAAMRRYPADREFWMRALRDAGLHGGVVDETLGTRAALPGE
jgi:thiosulfate dehydrogenase (quinone) large subunit